MSQHIRNNRSLTERAGRVSASVLGVVALILSASAASGLSFGSQPPQPKINVEAERTSQGAKINIRGQAFPPLARLKITATRAPGANGQQDFGMISADSAGKFNFRKTVGCTSSNSQDGAEKVTFMVSDSATAAKATAQVLGGAWVCQ